MALNFCQNDFKVFDFMMGNDMGYNFAFGKFSPNPIFRELGGWKRPDLGYLWRSISSLELQGIWWGLEFW
jgi:hypothetical protein